MCHFTSPGMPSPKILSNTNSYIKILHKLAERNENRSTTAQQQFCIKKKENKENKNKTTVYVKRDQKSDTQHNIIIFGHTYNFFPSFLFHKHNFICVYRLQVKNMFRIEVQYNNQYRNEPLLHTINAKKKNNFFFFLFST